MKERKRKSFSTELTKRVMAVVTFAFLSVFGVFMLITYQSSRSHEIKNQIYQLETAAVHIKTVQDTVRNIERQVFADDAVQDVIRRKEESTGRYLYIKRRAQNRLNSYAHIVELIEEIMLYTEDGRTFTSRTIRDPFRPEKYPWYEDVLSDPGRMFSVAHNSEATQDGAVTDVISYVDQYVQPELDYPRKGNIILNVRLDALKRLAAPESAMLKGYALFDSFGNQIFQEGGADLTYEQVLQYGNQDVKKIITMPKGDVCLVTDKLDDGWYLASVISGEVLMKQVWQICAFPGVLFVVTLFLLFVLLRILIRKMIRPINELSNAAQKVGQGDFSVHVEATSDDEVGMLTSVFNRMVVSIRSLMQSSVEHEKQTRRMQVENLMLQINPHFIYNTLNSIVYMARMGESNKIASFTNSFIYLLQSTLTIRDSVYSTVKDELTTVENYLSLQKYRYDDKFAYEISCDEELKSCTVLNVMLQPIVENAIFHGIAPKDGSGLIQIRVWREAEVLKICVEDDGIGMDQETIEMQLSHSDVYQKDGVRKLGVANVKERIQEVYGKEYGLAIYSEPEVGTKVTMTIPYRPGKKDHKEGEKND